MRGLVHLKKDYHRNAADHVMGECDIDVAVSKVESSGQPFRIWAEFPKQLVRGFAPSGLLP
jgi:hypothetical protein